MSSDEAENFAKRLLAAAPEFGPVHKEHLHDNGETLGYVFLGDVTRMVIKSCNSGKSANVTAVLNFFESELASGEGPVCDMIVLGFCENLMGEDEGLKVLRPMMGPNLSAALKRAFGT